MSKIIRKWNEWIAFPLALALVYWSEDIIRFFYPNSTDYGKGFHYDMLNTLVVWLMFIGISYIIFKLQFPGFEKYMHSEKFDSDFKSLPEHMKIYVSLGV
ncbi:MAG TPA: hypothetical protein VEA37_03980, partial [Flavobacterium sp.]|nr:hypothetical protein [Flavobacterium sp.]